MKKKNEQKAAVNDGSVAGMFLGLLIGLLIPNVLIMLGSSGETIIFISFIALLLGIGWTNDNLPAKSVRHDIDPVPVDSENRYIVEEEFMVRRTPKHWLGDAVERAADELQADEHYVPDEEFKVMFLNWLRMRQAPYFDREE